MFIPPAVAAQLPTPTVPRTLTPAPPRVVLPPSVIEALIAAVSSRQGAEGQLVAAEAPEGQLVAALPEVASQTPQMFIPPEVAALLPTLGLPPRVAASLPTTPLDPQLVEALVAAAGGSARAPQPVGSAAGSSAAPTPLVLQDIGRQAMTPAQPGAAPRTPPPQPTANARWLRLNEAPAEKRSTAARVGLKYMPENFPVLKDGIFLREVYGMPDRIKTRANIAESGFADRILQNEPEPAPVRHFVDNTYTTNAARTMAAEIYDTKMQFADKDLDAGFFATVWPMMIKRTPWKKYADAYPQDFVAGKAEIMNTFGKLMNALGAL
jgi:hypothetical protein